MFRVQSSTTFTPPTKWNEATNTLSFFIAAPSPRRRDSSPFFRTLSERDAFHLRPALCLRKQAGGDRPLRDGSSFSGSMGQGGGLRPGAVARRQSGVAETRLAPP